jgi:CheY-like chemotaxis protein
MPEKNENIPILLLAEDDEDDYLLARDALAEARFHCRLLRVKNGEELLDYLHRKGAFENPREFPLPDLILLDLNMPKKDGRRALSEIKSHSTLRLTPVVILTTSQNHDDVLQCYDLGANAFIRKPAHFDRIVEMMKALKKFWFETAELPQISP